MLNAAAAVGNSWNDRMSLFDVFRRCPMSSDEDICVSCPHPLVGCPLRGSGHRGDIGFGDSMFVPCSPINTPPLPPSLPQMDAKRPAASTTRLTSFSVETILALNSRSSDTLFVASASGRTFAEPTIPVFHASVPPRERFLSTQRHNRSVRDDAGYGLTKTGKSANLALNLISVVDLA